MPQRQDLVVLRGDDPRLRDRDQPAEERVIVLIAIYGAGADLEAGGVDQVCRPAGMEHGRRVGQGPQQLPGPTRMIEMDVRQNGVIDRLAGDPKRIEGGEQPGHRAVRPGIHEGGAAVAHDQVARGQPGPDVAEIDRVDSVFVGSNLGALHGCRVPRAGATSRAPWTSRARYYPGKEVGQAFQPDKAQSQAGKPDLHAFLFVPG